MTRDPSPPASDEPPPDETLTHASSSSGAQLQPDETLTHAPAGGGAPPPQPGPAATLTHSPAAAGPDQTLTHRPSGDVTARAASPLIDWTVGAVVDKRYEILDVLGAGGMGAVYRVRHLGWGVELAVKTPLAELLQDKAAVLRFRREARTWAGFGLHPNVAQCFYVREIGGLPRIFVEWVSGGTLKEWIARDQGRKPLNEALDKALQLLDALAFAHDRGVVHRDVKPANCLLTPAGDVKLTDFGLVKVAGAADVEGGRSAGAGPELTQVDQGMGTPQYGAPEQWTAARAVGPPADLYSFGVLLFELCSGRRPFDEAGQREPAEVLINRHLYMDPPALTGVPQKLAALVALCLAKDPERRPDASTIRAGLCGVYQDLCGKPYPREQPVVPTRTAPALCNQGLSFYDLGQVDEARRCWEEALSIEPQHLESFYNLGLLDWRSGRRWDRHLVEKLEEVAAAQGRETLSLLLRAQVQAERGDATAVEKLLAEFPKDMAQEEQAALRDRCASLTAACRKDPFPFLSEWQLLGLDVNNTLVAGVAPPAASGERPRLLVWTRDGTSVCDLQISYSSTLPRLDPLGRRVYVANTGTGALEGWGHPGQLELTQRSDPVQLQLTLPRPDPKLVFRAWALSLDGCRAAVSYDAARSPAPGPPPQSLVVVWDLLRGVEHARLAVGRDVQAVALDATGERLLVAHRNPDQSPYLTSLIRVRDGATLHAFPRRRPARNPAINRVAFTPDDRACAVMSWGGVEVWDAATGGPLASFGQGSVRSALSVDGRYVLEGREHDLTVGELASGQTFTTACPENLTFFGMWCDPARAGAVLTGRPAGAVALPVLATSYRAPFALARVRASATTLAEQEEFRTELAAARSAYRERRFSEALQHLRAAREQPGLSQAPDALDLHTQLYSVLPRQGLRGAWKLASWTANLHTVLHVFFSADGDRVLVRGSLDKQPRVEVWKSGSGAPVTGWDAPPFKQLLRRPDGALVAPDGVYSEAGARLEVHGGSHPQDLYLSAGVLGVGMSARGGAVVDQRSGREYYCASNRSFLCALAPSGAFALCGKDQLEVWELALQRTRHPLRPGGNRPARVALDLSERRALVVHPRVEQAGLGTQESIQVWDLVTGRRLRDLTFPDDESTCSALALSPCGRFAATGFGGGRLIVWDLERGTPAELPRQPGLIADAAFSDDGRFLLTRLGGISGSPPVLTTWFLDWELGSPPTTDWDPRADDHLRAFLELHCRPDSPAVEAPQSKALLAQRPKPSWGPPDQARLLQTLGGAGLGWIPAERVQARLQELVASWGNSTQARPSPAPAQPRTALAPKPPGVRPQPPHAGGPRPLQGPSRKRPQPRRPAPGPRAQLPRPAPSPTPDQKPGPSELEPLHGAELLERLLQQACEATDYTNRQSNGACAMWAIALVVGFLATKLVHPGLGLLLGAAVIGVGTFLVLLPRDRELTEAVMQDFLPRVRKHTAGKVSPSEAKQWVQGVKDVPLRKVLVRFESLLLQNLQR